MYEGAPNFPRPDRFWRIIEKHRRHHLLHRAHRHPRLHEMGRRAAAEARPVARCACSAPSASRSIPRRGCGTTSVIGGERCPIVDTWWQTETGAHHDHAAAGRDRRPSPARPARPFPGIDADVVNEQGEVGAATRAACSSSASPGPACCAASTATPSATADLLVASSRQCYFTGDGARRDEDGYFWISGRIDDVIKVRGHRLGTMEIESALVGHTAVAEAAVVGKPHEIKGKAIVCVRHAARPAARPDRSC